MILAALLQAVLDDYAVRQRRSGSDAALRVRHLLRHLRGDPAALTTRDLLAYAAARQREGVRGPTVNRELAVLRRGFNLCGLPWRTPKRNWRQLPESEPREGFFEWADFARVLAELPPPLRPPLLFAYITGWRLKSDVLALRWDAVDFAKGEVRIRTRKTRTPILFPMLPQLRQLLESQKLVVAERRHSGKRPNDDFVFTRDGSRIRWCYDAWLGACQRAGVGHRMMHDLRRTAARNLVAAGIDRKTAMRLIGHKTESIFTRYQIVDDSDLRAAAEKLGRYLPA